MGCGESSVDHTTPAKKSSSQGQTKPAATTTTSESKPQKTSNSNEISIVQDEFDQQDVKILLLGSGECGKTTLWRHLKMIYCGGFNDDERNDMTSVVKINLISDIKTLVEAIQNSGQNVADDLEASVENINDMQLNEEELTPEVAEEITNVWHDPAIRTAYQQNNSIGLGDNASFFLDNSKRIASNGYLPTDEDLLKSRIRTSGISSLQFKINNQIKTELVDVGGQKCERSKWQKCFQGVDYLIFVVSLSDFDQFMFEDDTMKRTQDSITLFQNTANSPVFAQKPIFLVLNKTDVFEKKLKEFPDQFKETYPDFDGDTSNVEACIEHVKSRFLRELSPDRNTTTAWVETVKTCAMNQQSVRNLFQNIAKKIVSARK